QRAADMKAILQTPPDQAAIARLSGDTVFNATMRTTCVATRLDAGHANNALPQTALANVNCRILPGHSREEVRQQLVKIFADPKVEVRYVANDGQVMDRAPEKLGNSPVQLRPDVMQTLDKLAAEMWPGAPVIPTMSTGASDGIYTNAAGLPTYGISGTAIDMDDVRAHGRDERLGVQSYYNGVQFYYLFLKALTGGK
ncbi:MAG TPA: M20/M25/M40 family metallo-hydrolase, partial [Terriglobales bacterium]|nr:M20/M25/M40 family metallo-hydrolase [Terriglobales bacterium]